MSIVLLTALIAGYIVYDTSKDVGVEIDKQAQTANVIWNRATTTSVVTEVSDTEKPETVKGITTKKNINGNYILVEVNGKKVEGGDKYTLLVTDTKISGRICNSFSGGYTLAGNVLVAGPLGSTKMACGGEAGIYENIFFGMITTKPTFENMNDKMILTSGGDKVVFEHVYE